MKKRHHALGQPKKRKKRGIAFYLIWTFGLSFILFLLSGAVLFIYYSRNLPDYSQLKTRAFNSYSIVYSEEDEVVGKFLPENRIPIPYERFPNTLIQAFVAAEDSDFFHHSGVDYKGIARALFRNLLAGRIVQGGSTITQQVTKTFFLTPKRSYLRKLKEVAYAFGLEHNLTKEEILSLYLNNIYLGNGAYGIEAAAESYFNKRVEQLNLAETALIAGLVKAPSRYSPINNFTRAKHRQTYVLGRMEELGYITLVQKDRALKTPIKLQSRESAYFSKAPYFTESIRHQIEKKYGKEKLYQEGLRIYTTLDVSLQKAAQQAVDQGLRALDKRQGFRGPIRTVSEVEARNLSKKKGASSPLSFQDTQEAVVLSKDDGKKNYTVWVEDRKALLPYSEMKWALTLKPTPHFKPGKIKDVSDLLRPGDVVQVRLKDSSKKDSLPMVTLEQEPLVQGALLCIDPRTGHVKAMVGGRDFSESQFNRAVNSRRQPGSAFKPLVYAAALEKGFNPSTILMDSPIEYENHDDGSYWAPKNYDKHYMGPITFRNALAHSRNVVTVKILEDIGIGFALKFFKRMGIDSSVKRNLSIALGTSEVSMPEIASAFGVFANGGERVKPIIIRKIATMKGEVLEEQDPYIELEEKEEDDEPAPPSQVPLRERVLSPQHAYQMTHLLEGVIQHGTGQAAKYLGRALAGKTGTSSDYGDAWFIGYSPSLLTAVWVGFDAKSSIGRNETGSRAALPIWISFMERALRESPGESFKVPEGVTLLKVDLETGLPPTAHSKDIILEAFLDGNPPQSVERESTRKEGSFSDPAARGGLPPSRAQGP